MNGSPARGLHYLLEGFRLIRQPGLRPFVLIPLLVNCLLFGGAIWWGYQQVAALNALLMAWLPGWLEWLSWLIWPLFFLMALLIVFYGFSVVTNLIASPFNGLLAERVEMLLTGAPLPVENSWGKLLMMVPHALLREIRKLLYYLPLLIGVLLITLIPAVNGVAPALWFVFGAWMMAVQYIDYPIDNHELKFASVLQAVRLRRGTSYGFGGAVMLGTMIPIVNLVIMPAAICGATLWWVREVRDELPRAR